MKAPLSWIKDYIDLEGIGIEELANLMTSVGLEVESILLVGVEKPEGKLKNKYAGLPWDREKFVVAEVVEVNQHPNADRLTLCELDDGTGITTVLTGAPNMFPWLGKGRLEQPLKVAYAREGAVLYDGHQPGQVLTRLKRAVIRGVESRSMICSEKELGISEESDGVIELDADAPVGMPLVDYMGDVVYEVAILPNMARDASILGIARELSAVTGRPLRLPEGIALEKGGAIAEKVGLEVRDAELNPRFMLGMVEGTQARRSPYWVRRRLSMAGMRPIDALVDATNYTMLETGQPLHAFDYDLLRERAGGKPTIITRTATEGEKIILLDGSEPKLDAQIELVTDTAGPLSIAGVMGGGETGVHAGTRNLLIESANWNFINLRKTLTKTRLSSEAAYRFSREVHPALAETALSLCLKRVREWGGGEVVRGVLDEYGKPYTDTVNRITAKTIADVLGQEISLEESAQILERLGFTCRIDGEVLEATSPATRTDIEFGIIGQRNLIEEIARIHGYESIAPKRLSDELPPQVGNPALEAEERVRDILVSIGLQDTLAYRQTSPEREARIYVGRKAPEGLEYVRLRTPITPERTVMRRSGMATMLELLEHNAKFRPGLALFELGPVFLPVEGETLPHEALRLSIGMTGAWDTASWDKAQSQPMDFFDLKGVVEALLDGLHLTEVRFQAANHPSFHPGKCAEVWVGEEVLGVMGELHPQVRKNYAFGQDPVLAAEFDGEKLTRLSSADFANKAISSYPAMVEDIALIVDESVPADALEALIRQSGGKLLVDVRLFDVYRDEKLGSGRKSLAYQLTYQAFDRTLTDKDALNIRNRIVKQTKNVFGAQLRSL
ncbi:MAG: phenylalanine--tRNA ligase subunit beta [Anaerolineaceae bacterium]